ncbi:MAG: ABC transporter ATP-binding protein [Gammaproteobacteria bacterium]|nr:ABC transporter ATP-binding protein [Gammaproteobacteria bacterium]
MNTPVETPWMKLQGINFSRSGRTILSDISLQFGRRELTLLTGHNGSGKTTLLRILAGLLKPDSAALELDGNRLTGGWLRNRGILRANSCYLHQQPYLFDATVFDNVAYGLRRRGLNSSAIEHLVGEALEATALSHLRRRRCGELSGGEKQRVAMLRAWVLAPRLLLLDEPVANMDKPSRSKCLALINQMQCDNIAVVLTSHDPQQGELQISRHLHLYQGRMISKGSSKNSPDDNSRDEIE